MSKLKQNAWVFHLVEEDHAVLLALVLHPKVEAFNVLLNKDLLGLDLHQGRRVLLLFHVLIQYVSNVEQISHFDALLTCVKENSGNKRVQGDGRRFLLTKVQVLSELKTHLLFLATVALLEEIHQVDGLQILNEDFAQLVFPKSHRFCESLVEVF